MSDEHAEGPDSWKGRNVCCFKCGHRWTSRSDERPVSCPSCRSRRFDVPSREHRCSRCGAGWVPKDFDDACPYCGLPVSDIGKGTEFSCNQCGHHWVSRGSEKPVKCPRCKSRNWGEPKIPRLTCRKCGYVWKSRTEAPKYCPGCKSSTWDKDTFKLKCFRCGHKWVLSEGADPDTVRTCPSCRSKKWNELPPVRTCSMCHGRFVSRAPGKVCPACAGKAAHRMECGFCGTSWTAEREARVCPVCGLVLSGEDGSEKNTTLWDDGESKLDYLFKDGIGCVYLWKRGYPDSCEYLDSLLERKNLRYNTLVGRAMDDRYGDFWRGLAEDLHARRDMYAENIPYLAGRLGLDPGDAEILALHFVGMSPEVITLRLDMNIRDVRAAFTRIQDAYRRSDIVVNDSVYTDDPISCYDGERWTFLTGMVPHFGTVSPQCKQKRPHYYTFLRIGQIIYMIPPSIGWVLQHGWDTDDRRVRIPDGHEAPRAHPARWRPDRRCRP